MDDTRQLVAGEAMGMVLSFTSAFRWCKNIGAILCIVLAQVRPEFDCCRIMQRIKRTVKWEVPPGDNNYGI